MTSSAVTGDPGQVARPRVRAGELQRMLPHSVRADETGRRPSSRVRRRLVRLLAHRGTAASRSFDRAAGRAVEPSRYFSTFSDYADVPSTFDTLLQALAAGLPPTMLAMGLSHPRWKWVGLKG
jgi:hypothetical protein